MIVALAAFAFLLQTAAVTPTPEATPTPKPVSAGPRTLQDVARERRLTTAGKGKGSLGTITMGPSTSGAAPATSSAKANGTPAASADGEPARDPEPSSADVRVVSASNDGIVDAGGGVRVTGSVRNAGDRTACGILLSVKILDSRGQFLASSQAVPDVPILAPGEISSFHVTVQAPPGVRGARTSPERKDLTDGSTTMPGDWKLLGGSEASVASATESCPK